MISLEQLGGLARARATLMPATGSSSISSSGSWISSMPISSHCFWPWLRVRAGSVEVVLEKDHLGDLVARARVTSSVRFEEQRAETLRPRGNEISRFSNTVRFS